MISYCVFVDSKASKSKDGLLGNFGITALVGVIAGVFLLMLFGCVTVFCLLKKVQKSANSQTASVLGSRPVSMENGSLAVRQPYFALLNNIY